MDKVFKGGLGAYNERRRVNLKFCRADFAYSIQELKSNCLQLGNKYAGIVVPSVGLLNHVNKICQRELCIYPSPFFLST